jgi:hypothetical protein
VEIPVILTPNLGLNFQVWKHDIPAHVDPLISENGAKILERVAPLISDFSNGFIYDISTVLSFEALIIIM